MISTAFGRGGPNPVIENRLGELENYIGNGFVFVDSSKPSRLAILKYTMDWVDAPPITLNK